MTRKQDGLVAKHVPLQVCEPERLPQLLLQHGSLPVERKLLDLQLNLQLKLQSLPLLDLQLKLRQDK